MFCCADCVLDAASLPRLLLTAPLLVQLFKSYKPDVHPVAFVRELVQFVNTVFRLLESGDPLVVLKKRRRRKKKATTQGSSGR